MHRADLDPDPLVQFERWYAEARRAADFPEAVALATASPDGRPSARMVLLKGFDEQGFRFYTNLESRKGRELAANPRAALLFHWPAAGRQVRVEGPVAQVSREEALAYFRSRARESQVSAAASPQSRVVASRDELERRAADVRARHEAGDVELPANWGGYRVRPEELEFWQHRENRLHDRFRYRRDGDAWVVERLAP